MFDGYANQVQQDPNPAPPSQKVLRFDKGYVKTLPGILKIVQLLCNLIGFICLKVSWAWLSSIFYNILYWVANIITLFLFCMYMFHFVEKYDRLPWMKFEFFYCGVVVLTYIVLSIIATTVGENGYAVGFFGLCAIIAYGYDSYLKYRSWKRGLPPQ
ncbi:PREDICTED: proteolipid protein 2-like isoform X2 [Papilio polytes]|nr:PREDICTED: proteolipid protein 2-like isoform X2 [Papilio polytes]